MIDKIGIVKSNLKKYPSISKYFGRIIKQRLRIECFTYGVLTAHLLEPTEYTNVDLQRLEAILQVGEKYCKDFSRIFSGKHLSDDSVIADGQIIDVLAEVKGFELLHNQGFSEIYNVKRSSFKTVDFIAKRNEKKYAIEVTRLGLSQSEKKQPQFTNKISSLKYDKCEDATGWELSIITAGNNVDRLKIEIEDAINKKHEQIQQFCESQKGAWNVILLISSGRDYFIMKKYENKEYHRFNDSDVHNFVKFYCYCTRMGRLARK